MVRKEGRLHHSDVQRHYALPGGVLLLSQHLQHVPQQLVQHPRRNPDPEPESDLSTDSVRLPRSVRQQHRSAGPADLPELDLHQIRQTRV